MILSEEIAEFKCGPPFSERKWGRIHQQAWQEKIGMFLIFAFTVRKKRCWWFYPLLCRVDALKRLMFFVGHCSYSILASIGDWALYFTCQGSEKWMLELVAPWVLPLQLPFPWVSARYCWSFGGKLFLLRQTLPYVFWNSLWINGFTHWCNCKAILTCL